MKLSSKSVFLLVTGIVVIMITSLGMVYTRSGEQQSELYEQLDLIQPVLSKSSSREVCSQLTEMEERQEKAEQQLTATKVQLYLPLEAIDIAGELLDIARTANVEILLISSPGITEKRLGGMAFSVLPVRLDIVGDIADLIAFIAGFCDKYPTGLVKSVQVDISLPEEDKEETDTGEPVEPPLPSAKLEVQICTYEGD
jgi:hypothetical protein